jgi:hypothetical protein
MWAELHSVGAFPVMVYLDDDEQGSAYANHVFSCPKCDTRLGTELGGVTLHEVAGAPWPR